MKSIYYQLKYELKKVFRDKTLLMLTYLMPIGFYFMMGFFMIEINPSFLEIMIPSMSIFTILTSTLMSIPTTIVDNRNSGVLRSYKINGISKYQYLLVNTLSSMIHILLVNTFIMISAYYLFNAPLPINYLSYYLLIILGCFTFTGISSLIGIVSKSNKTTVLIAQLIYLPSMILSGIMVPKEMMPESIATASNIIPTTHLMNVLNNISFINAFSAVNIYSIILLVLVSLVAYLVSIFRFSYNENK